MTVPLADAPPNLSVATQSLQNMYGFGKADMFKGFWRLPLHEDSQEIFSFMTEDGVYTPLRVPKGARDSAMHFQMQMQECFKEMLYEALLVWIDDVLLFAASPHEYIQQLRKFFSILRERNLKLNINKCELFTKSVVWCGNVIDGQGVSHDPSRLHALCEMPRPPTAAALQYFLCAVNWLRDHLIAYARVSAPLQDWLTRIMATRGRRKVQLSGVQLNWEEREIEAFPASVGVSGIVSEAAFCRFCCRLLFVH